MKQNNDILVEFKRVTGKDILSFFKESLNFFQTDYDTIVQYFSGKLKSIDSLCFKRFELLRQRRDEMFEAYHNHGNVMKGSGWWIILEQLEEIDSRLNTLQNINRWARSSATSFSYSPNIQIQHVLGQFETLEGVAKNILDQNNFQDSWTKIALDNQLSEEDYSTDGGVSLNLQLDNTVGLGVVVNSVVDFLVGKSIYGKDLDKKLTIDSTTEDLVVLSYDDTMLQTVNILIGLRKNDNPDYPYLGLQSTVVVGSNRAIFNFPIISRQLSETFESDDSIKNFQILDLSVEQDNVAISFSVKTRLNEVIPSSVLL